MLTATAVILFPILLSSSSGAIQEAPAGDPPAGSAPATVSRTGSLGDRLGEFLEEESARGFSGVVLVAVEGKVVMDRGYGLADRLRRIPNTADTIFNICSMSKVFTAAAVLRLETEGKLTVQDTLESQLGEFPAAKSSATIHHLLIHVGGLARSGTELDYSGRDEFVESMKQAPVESSPGEQYRYSNAGYSLLAAIVEEVSGKPFEAYLRESLLEPAGIENAAFLGEISPDDARLAKGYEDGETTEPADLGEYDRGTRGAGGMLLRMRDLYEWEKSLENASVLSESALKKMFVAYFGDEGYGWHVARSRRGTAVHHRGCGNPGFEGQFARYPEEGVTILVGANSREGWRKRIWEGIEQIVFDEGPE